jgi:hypothetical protein
MDDSLASSSSLPLPDPTPSTSTTAAQRYTSSVHSSTTSSCRPSGEPLTPALSEADSLTSLESLARDGFVDRHINDSQEEEDRENSTSLQAFEGKEMPRFSLVDSGPVTLQTKPSIVFSDASSTIETWRDCEN